MTGKEENLEPKKGIKNLIPRRIIYMLAGAVSLFSSAATDYYHELSDKGETVPANILLVNKIEQNAIGIDHLTIKIPPELVSHVSAQNTNIVDITKESDVKKAIKPSKDVFYEIDINTNGQSYKVKVNSELFKEAASAINLFENSFPSIVNNINKNALGKNSLSITFPEQLLSSVVKYSKLGINNLRDTTGIGNGKYSIKVSTEYDKETYKVPITPENFAESVRAFNFFENKIAEELAKKTKAPGLDIKQMSAKAVSTEKTIAPVIVR